MTINPCRFCGARVWIIPPRNNKCESCGRTGPLFKGEDSLEKRIADAIRGACPELFTEETGYSDFPELCTRANIMPLFTEGNYDGQQEIERLREHADVDANHPYLNNRYVRVLEGSVRLWLSEFQQAHKENIIDPDDQAVLDHEENRNAWLKAPEDRTMVEQERAEEYEGARIRIEGE